MSGRIGRFITVAQEGRVATVRFDRGDATNALSLELLRDLRLAAESFRDDTSTSAIVLAGGAAFTAGADLADPALSERAAAPLIERRQMLRAGPDMCEAWAGLEQITIAAVERYCIGGGVSLAASCDFRIAGGSAFFALPEVPKGMNMSWHTVPRLVRLIGPARAKRFVLLGERLAAADALAQGLADEVAQDGQALAAAQALAAKVAALPPVPARMTKQAVNAAAHALDAATTYMDLDQFALTASSDDYREAVTAFFEKRPPRFTGG